jgi:hypothetical protein
MHVTKPLDSPRIPLYISITGKFCRRGIIVLPLKGTAFRAQTKNDKGEEDNTKDWWQAAVKTIPNDKRRHFNGLCIYVV